MQLLLDAAASVEHHDGRVGRVESNVEGLRCLVIAAPPRHRKEASALVVEVGGEAAGSVFVRVRHTVAFSHVRVQVLYDGAPRTVAASRHQAAVRVVRAAQRDGVVAPGHACQPAARVVLQSVERVARRHEPVCVVCVRRVSSTRHCITRVKLDGGGVGVVPQLHHVAVGVVRHRPRQPVVHDHLAEAAGRVVREQEGTDVARAHLAAPAAQAAVRVVRRLEREDGVVTEAEPHRRRASERVHRAHHRGARVLDDATFAMRPVEREAGHA